MGYTAGAYPCFNDASVTRAPPQLDGWFSFSAEAIEAMKS